MESEQRKKIDEAIEEERARIVESTKIFVLEREKANEEQMKDLREDIELKEKRVKTLQVKVKHLEEDCKEKEYALDQERKSCERLVSAAEERVTWLGSNNKSSNAHFNGDEVKELNERLENAKAQNEELRVDFSKMVDDYEKSVEKEKREVNKLKTQCDKLKAQYEKKDIELRKFLSAGKDQVKNSQLVEDLRSKLLASDEKFVEMQFKNEDLENALKTKSSGYEKDINSLNKRVSSLLGDNEQLRKKIEEITNSLNKLTKEDLKLIQNAASYPFAKVSGVSPLTKSMSTLKVLSSEDEKTDVEQVFTEPKLSTFKQNETPKRVSDSITGQLHVFFTIELFYTR